jgi:hypothetical protein
MPGAEASGVPGPRSSVEPGPGSSKPGPPLTAQLVFGNAETLHCLAAAGGTPPLVRCEVDDGSTQIGTGLIQLGQSLLGESAHQSLLHEIVGFYIDWACHCCDPSQSRIELSYQFPLSVIEVGPFRHQATPLSYTSKTPNNVEV